MIDCILIFFLNFIDYRIAFLSIADVALIVLIVRAMLIRIKLKCSRNELILIGLMLINILISTMLNMGKEYFLITDFLVALVKMVFYIVGGLYIPDYLTKKKVKVLSILEKYFLVAGVGGILQQIIVLICGRESWPLFSLGSQFFGLTSDTTMFVNTGLMRSRSFYSEPAHYAVHMSMLYALFLFNEKYRKKMWLHLIYILAVVSANAMSGYAVMVMIYVIYFLNFKKVKKVIKMLSGILLGIVGGGAVWLTNDYIRKRMMDFFVLKDHSGIVRTIGGFFFLEYIPFWGVGLGNHSNYYFSLEINDTMWFSGSGEFYNNILLAIITMGYVGGVLFIAYQYVILKNHKKLFFALMVTHAGWGKLLTAPIWIFLLLYKNIYRNGEECKEKIADSGGTMK